MGKYSYHHTSGNCTPFLCLEKWRKSTLFPIILPRREAEDKSYCLCILSLAELIKSSVFNLFPASFLPYLSGREDRQQFQPGNSACSYGYIFCRSCCTAACRSSPRKEAHSCFHFLLRLIVPAHPFPGLPSSGGFRSAHSIFGLRELPQDRGLIHSRLLIL